MKSYLYAALAMLCLSISTPGHAQYINTIIGQPDNTGYMGDGGQATAALLFSPSDVVLDKVGNIYVTDFINNVIRKVDTFGVITTVAGTGYGAGSTAGAGGAYSGDGGPATAADLNGPFAIALDSAENIYFADGYNHVVRKVNKTTGIITTIAGNDTAAYTGDGGPAIHASINNPVGLAFDHAGNLYIADDHNNVIRKVTPAGIITTFAGNHTAGYLGDGGAATAAELQTPIGVATDNLGNVYIADGDNNVIRKVNSAGIISTFAGTGVPGYSGDGGSATAAKLNKPQYVRPDDSGNVYIADFYNNVIRKVDSVGIIHAFAGIGTGAGTSGMSGGFSGDGGLAIDAELWVPQGIALRSGKVYVCDRGNQVVRLIGPNLDHTGVAGVKSSANELEVYPTPVTAGTFTMLLSENISEVANVAIINSVGQIVKQFSIATNKAETISVSVPPGIYILSASAGEKHWNKQLAIQ